MSLQTHKQAERIRQKIIDDIQTLEPISPDKLSSLRHRSDLPAGILQESIRKNNQKKISPERLDMIQERPAI